MLKPMSINTINLFGLNKAKSKNNKKKALSDLDNLEILKVKLDFYRWAFYLLLAYSAIMTGANISDTMLLT